MSKRPEHATLGASSAHRWMACGQSVQGGPYPDTTSEYADEGTAAHEIGARALEKDVDADLWLDTVIQTEKMKHAITVSDEMCEAVQVYVDYCRKRMKEAASVAGMQSWIETRFDLAPMNPPAPMYGTADFVLWQPAQKPQRQKVPGRTAVLTMPKPSLLEVVDYKHGSGIVVEAEENEQFMYYALGAVMELKVKPDKIRVTVVQPRAGHPDGIVRSWEFGWDELVAFKKRLFERARNALDPEAPFNPGDHCRFCPRQAECPAQQALVEEAAQTTFGALVETEEPEAALVDPKALTIEQLQRVMEVEPIIRSWLSSVSAHLKALTEQGVETGYKLVSGRAMRRWLDDEQAEAWLTQVLGDEAFTRKLKSVAQAEKALKPLGMALPEGYWNKVSNTTKLVPESDPRPALPPPETAQDVFDAGDLEDTLRESVAKTERDAAPEPEVIEAEVEEAPETDEVVDAEVELIGGTEEDVSDLIGVPTRVEVQGEEIDLSDELAATIAANKPDDYKPDTSAVSDDELAGEAELEDLTDPEWTINAPNEETFTVRAPNERAAARAARELKGWGRLPNHTKVEQA